MISETGSCLHKGILGRERRPVRSAFFYSYFPYAVFSHTGSFRSYFTVSVCY